MKRNQLITFFIMFLLSATVVRSQIPRHIFNEANEEQFQSKDFTNSTGTLKQNNGVYHFGESEGEWDLVLIPYKDSVIIQTWSFVWGENVGFKNLAWLPKCQTYNNVRVKGTKFYFSNYSGQFVTYKKGGKKEKAVLLLSDPIGGRNYQADSAEVGFFSSSIDTFFYDIERYQLSVDVKPESYFAGKSKLELKLLRNTVYANYGLILQKGGEMDNYFKKKDWYGAWKKDVSDCLTEIEKRNLTLLRKFESN